MQQKPNILFILTDDQRFDVIHALGCQQLQTPNIDKLVNNGSTFTHAHIQGGTSAAVCMPSRAMINTGADLFRFADAGRQVGQEFSLLGETFKNNGYTTFGTGKWHNGKEAFARCFDSGEEIFFGGMADHWNVPAYHFDPSGKYDKQCPYIENPGLSRDVKYKNCDHINAGQHSTETIASAALDFIRSQDKQDNPFFMYVSFLAPHDPRTMPAEFMEMYNPEDIELPENFSGGHTIDTGALNIRDEMLASFPRQPGEIKQHIAEYYGMISHLDYNLGLIITELEKQHKLEDTIIVFAGDNGLAVGQHGLMGKQSLYDHSVRIPLIFSGPGIKNDYRTDDLVFLNDIFPTLCELTDIEIPESVDAQSLAGALTKGEKSGRDFLTTAYEAYQRAIRYQNYKLIEYVIDGKVHARQLFNLEKDPIEVINLIDVPAEQDRIKQMHDMLYNEAVRNGDLESKWGQKFWSAFK